MQGFRASCLWVVKLRLESYELLDKGSFLRVSRQGSMLHARSLSCKPIFSECSAGIPAVIAQALA